jgi:hypothetical protein
MSWLEWGLQLAVLLLLGGALPFVFRLERALTALRRDRAAIEGGAASLAEATRMAEAASIRLRASAEMAGRQVAERMAAAEPLREDLRYLVERAEGLADRLDGTVRAARPLATEAAVAAEPPASPGRSRAEQELMRVLARGAAARR